MSSSQRVMVAMVLALLLLAAGFSLYHHVRFAEVLLRLVFV